MKLAIPRLTQIPAKHNNLLQRSSSRSAWYILPPPCISTTRSSSSLQREATMAGRRCNRRNTEVSDNNSDDEKDYSYDNNHSVNEAEKRISSLRFDIIQKNPSKRKQVLELILQHFKQNTHHKIIKDNSITILHGCLYYIVKGSCRDALLASQIIGLLALEVGCEERAREIYNDSVSKFSEGLKSFSNPDTLSCILDSLAIVTFVGGSDPEETQRSMQILWDFFCKKMLASEENFQVIVSAISAWSFLLATIHVWNISSKLWKESISYLSNLLAHPKEVVRIVAGETLAHLLEIGALDKFSNESTELDDATTRIQEWQSTKEKIQDQVKDAALIQANPNNSSKEDGIESYRSMSSNVIYYLKKGQRPQTTVMIGQKELPISQWSQLIQVDFLMRLTGRSFVRHVKQNELFQDFFDCAPAAKNLPDDYLLYNPDVEKEEIRYVLKVEMSIEDPLYKRQCVSANSPVNKAKTQLLNKHRVSAEAYKSGYYSVSLRDE